MVMDNMKGKFIRDRKVELKIEKILDRNNDDSTRLWEMSEQLIENIMKKYR